MVRPLASMLRNLRHTAVGGGPDAPPTLAPSRPRWLRRAVRAALVVLAVGLALFALEAGWHAPGTVGGVTTSQVVVWVLSASPLVVLAYRPLLAWRVAWVLALVGLLLSDPCPPSGRLDGTVALYATDWTIEWSCDASWYPGQVLVFAIVLFAVGTAQERGVLGWVWVATAALAVAAVDAGYGSDRDVALLPAAVTALLAAGHLTRRRAQARQRLAAAEERGTVLTERARIARELHDVVAHHMSMIAVRAETAPYRLGELPEPARVELTEISQASREALAEMRRLLGVLRTGEPAPATAPQPGLADLPELVEAARAAGAEVSVDIDRTRLPELPAGIGVSAYRIAQEALTNAARHAPGAPIRVVVERTSDGLSVLVRNGAPPAPPAPAPAAGGAGHGIRGMRERAAMLGGELRAAPTPDRGFEVAVTLPLAGVR